MPEKHLIYITLIHGELTRMPKAYDVAALAICTKSQCVSYSLIKTHVLTRFLFNTISYSTMTGVISVLLLEGKKAELLSEGL